MRAAHLFCCLYVIGTIAACGGPGASDENASDAEAWRRRKVGIDAGSADSGTVLDSGSTNLDATNDAPPPGDGGASAPVTDCTVTRCHYVRSGAMGVQDGSDWNNAYASLPSQLVRGDTYFVAGGSYPALTLSTPNSGTMTITIKGATNADHGTDAGWQAALSVAVADGGRQAVFASGGLTFDTDYWNVDGNVGIGESAHGTSGNYGFGVHDPSLTVAGGLCATFHNDAAGITLSHFECDGVSWDVPQDQGGANAFYIPGACCFNFTNGALFDHVFAHDQKGSVFVTGGNITVQHSYIDKVRSTAAWHGEGVASRCDGGTGKTDHAVYRWNRWTDVLGTGQIVALYNTCRNMEVYGNVFVWDSPALCTNCGDAAWPTIDNTNQGTIVGLKFYNNTIYNLPGNAGVGNINGSSGYDVQNNLWYASGYGVSLSDSHDYNAMWDSYVYGCSGGGCPNTHESYRCFASDGSDPSGKCTGNAPNLDAPAAGAVFVSPAAYDLHPLANVISGISIGGNALGAPYDVDFDGKKRTSWTLGAYESP